MFSTLQKKEGLEHYLALERFPVNISNTKLHLQLVTWQKMPMVSWIAAAIHRGEDKQLCALQLEKYSE